MPRWGWCLHCTVPFGLLTSIFRYGCRAHTKCIKCVQCRCILTKTYTCIYAHHCCEPRSVDSFSISGFLWSIYVFVNHVRKQYRWKGTRKPHTIQCFFFQLTRKMNFFLLKCANVGHFVDFTTMNCNAFESIVETSLYDEERDVTSKNEKKWWP